MVDRLTINDALLLGNITFYVDGFPRKYNFPKIKYTKWLSVFLSFHPSISLSPALFSPSPHSPVMLTQHITQVCTVPYRCLTLGSLCYSKPSPVF